MTTNSAYLYAGLRTPFGRLNGHLSQYDAVELGTRTLAELGRRHPVAAEADGALFSCVVQAGLGPNPARTVMHRSGVGSEIPASVNNMACIAGIDTMVDATRRIASQEGSLYIVGAFESSSNGPALTFGDGHQESALQHEALTCAISGESFVAISDRQGAELGISRARQDQWAVRSHDLAGRADFATTGEVYGLESDGTVHWKDEGIRAGSTYERLAALPPLVTGGTITAANASQIADGSAMGLVGSVDVAESHGLDPLARIVGWAYSAGPDNTLHRQPAKSIDALLTKTGHTVRDIDLWEINEAFASVVLATIDDLKIPEEAVNPNGGGIAIGHPNSTTAFRQVLTLAHELRRRDLRRGIATLCGGGGQGIALLIENAH
ncbi:thiolase family protein [Antrihabitans cavernicola]|uniref:Probable acetyl-CoA acetyltransferase n=1 Tax=Antrihabitans cavernicola TaxID=2495913 RepID=A0A5A7SHR4_9NOCA|nr:thiolase family protein [Spelaeibacter cavernicola]KAA0024899.1 thiolase family protein [Spelaeibacter cavernicola]